MAALALAVAACGSAEKTAVSEPPISPVPVTAISQISPPVAAISPSVQDNQVFGRAQYALTRACVRRFGVQYTDVPIASTPLLEGFDRRFGTVERADVERWGFQSPSRAGAQGDDKAAGWNPSAREAEVVTGKDRAGAPSSLKDAAGRSVPKGGCALDAWRQLQGDAASARDLVEKVQSDAYRRALADSRAVKVQSEWSACMKDRGYTFAHRWDAGNSVANRGLDVQKLVAVADLGCAQQVNYLGVMYALEYAYEQRELDSREAEVIQVVAGKREIMARAAAALRGQ
ncbi:hypothetical protein [Nocardioides sp.]|uniref:hypothetical protein n=1 Tax=Nocardioides sp. TaxID=35761 RepID=UPI00262B30FB|nr:hypothetical protein [Nocardioides sp.]